MTAMVTDTPTESAGKADRREARPVRGATTLLRDTIAALRLRAATGRPEHTDAPTTAGADGAEASLGDIVDSLDERAFGILILLLALPCCLPFVYLLPQIVALPMLALAGQLAAGAHHPWLPQKMKARRFKIAEFEKVLTRSERYLGWIERIARPRLRAVTGDIGVRVVGALLLLPTASILIPLPSTNTVPGIGVAVAALGLIERDGLLVIGGLFLGLLWIALLAFFGLEAASLIKDFVLGGR
ncbi:MAG: exopolysaccharide biosynthesis protein [Pseudomonadota bacterium]